MNESDAQGEDDLGRREAEVGLVCFRLRLNVSNVGDERSSSALMHNSKQNQRTIEVLFIYLFNNSS